MGLTQITTGGVDDNINIDSNTLKVDGTNNRVGIGTAAPVYTLHVGDGSAQAMQRIDSNATALLSLKGGTSSECRIEFGDSGDDDIGKIYYDNSTNSMEFSTNASERMRIDSSGNVGIGTSSPAANAKLDVNGSVSISPNTAGKETFRLSTNAADDGRLLIKSNTTTKVDIQANGASYFNGGNVGIGTSSPDGTLHVHSNSAGSITANSGADDLVIENNGDTGISILTADGNNATGVFFGCPTQTVGAAIRYNNSTHEMSLGPDDPSGGYLRINSGDGVEAARIDSSGKVGIGTSAPVATNHIRGSGTSGQVTASWLLENASSGTVGMDVTGAAGSSIWRFLYAGGPSTGTNALTPALTIGVEGSAAGRVKCQAGYLYVQNSASGTGDTDGLVLISDGNADKYIWNYENTSLRFGTNSQERMRIDSSGNVGINVSNPTSKLHVNGTVTVNNIGSGAGTNTLKYNTSNGRITYDASSSRYKNNIRNADKGLSEVLQLLPRKFEYKDSGRTDFGFIAEEVVEVIPELVTLDGEGLPEAVNYDRFVSVLTAALQEAIAKIETLETKVAALEAG